MKQNVGILDSAVRSIIAVALLAIAAEGVFSMGVNIALVVVAMMLWYTVSFGVCLLYKALGIDTYPGATGNGLYQR